MTAPRQPRHRLAEDLGVPAPATPLEPPTQMLPIIPRQRAAVPQVYPSYPPATDWPARRAVAPSPAPRRPVVRRRILAGVTALVLALGVGVVVVVESGGPAGAAPFSGR